MTDYYATLGIQPDATAAAIKRAYRFRAREFHPDRNRASGAEERFKEIGEAYAVLGDPAQRRQYDAQQRARAAHGDSAPWDNDGATFNGEMDGELFDELFSRIFAEEISGDRARRHHASAAVELELTLEEAHSGTLRTLLVIDPRSGRPVSRRVRIPAGVADGQLLRIPGGASDMPALRIQVRVAAHADYRWHDGELLRNVTVSPWDAALGGSVAVMTVAGRVMLRIPAGTQGGQLFRIAGKGLAGADLLVRIDIAAPVATSGKQRTAYEALRDSFAGCA